MNLYCRDGIVEYNLRVMENYSNIVRAHFHEMCRCEASVILPDLESNVYWTVTAAVTVLWGARCWS